jgi:hypothetical protein
MCNEGYQCIYRVNDGYQWMFGHQHFADLRMTFRQNFFLQDWFRNKFGVGLD